MAKLYLVCDKCDSTTFKIQKIAGQYNGTYGCICAECGKHIATLNDYNIDWVTEEEDTDDSNPTA